MALEPLFWHLDAWFKLLFFPLVFVCAVPESLEHVLRTSIAEGQPGTGRAWKKVLIIVEGIYSMEGEICRLKEIVAIKKKYRVSQAALLLSQGHLCFHGQTGWAVA